MIKYLLVGFLIGLTFPVASYFIGNYGYKWFKAGEYTCPSARSLQGCEVTAIDLEKEIERTRWNLARCESSKEEYLSQIECLLDPMDCKEE